MSIPREARRRAAALLRAEGVTDAGFDAMLLLEKATGRSRTDLLLSGDELTPEEEARFDSLVGQRRRRIPLQHLLGETWFMGLRFAVRPGVLIPRQDTETLAETVLRELPERGKGLRVLDLCTGSGCVGLTLARLGNFARVTLSDISDEALDLAAENADALGVAGKIFLARGDLLQARRQDGRRLDRLRFDAVVCNPPYIPSGEIASLMPEVRDHDPRCALDGGRDGLDFYRRLSHDAAGVLVPGGWLFLEIGSGQADAVREILAARYDGIRVEQDLAGLDRVVWAVLPPAEEERSAPAAAEEEDHV